MKQVTPGENIMPATGSVNATDNTRQTVLSDISMRLDTLWILLFIANLPSLLLIIEFSSNNEALFDRFIYYSLPMNYDSELLA
jgi:hypothetical protein